MKESHPPNRRIISSMTSRTNARAQLQHRRSENAGKQLAPLTGVKLVPDSNCSIAYLAAYTGIARANFSKRYDKWESAGSQPCRC